MALIGFLRTAPEPLPPEIGALEIAACFALSQLLDTHPNGFDAQGGRPS